MMFLLAVLCFVCLTSCSEPEETLQVVDITNYITASATGYDGYGIVSFEIDYQKLADDTLASHDNKMRAVTLASIYPPFTAKIEKDGLLKNGDEIQVSWDMDDSSITVIEGYLSVDLICGEYSYIIENLLELDTYDPFENLVVDTKQTVSGSGYLEFKVHCKIADLDVMWNVTHDGENGSLKNGDVLTLSIADDIDFDAFTEATGLHIKKTTDTYTVTGLRELVKSEKIFSHIGENERAAFDKVIEDWVISGLNDQQVFETEKRTYRPFGYLFYSNETNRESPLNEYRDMLIAIYEISDPKMKDGYYVFIGIKGDFYCDINGITINGEGQIPSSFIYYEKETVRYSEKFGWGQNYETMGFLHDGIAYAGHKNIIETYSYIETTYGESYDNLCVSSELDGVLSPSVIGD